MDFREEAAEAFPAEAAPSAVAEAHEAFNGIQYKINAQLRLSVFCISLWVIHGLKFISNSVGRWLAAAVRLLFMYDDLRLKAIYKSAKVGRDRACPCPQQISYKIKFTDNRKGCPYGCANILISYQQ